MNSIISTERKCYVCGSTQGLEEHHIFGGNPNRKNSEDFGLKIFLCANCHRGNNGVHFNKELMQMLHEIGQTYFEKTHTREEFMRIFGRNYIYK